jgi:hypothetical protein
VGEIRKANPKVVVLLSDDDPKMGPADDTLETLGRDFMHFVCGSDYTDNPIGPDPEKAAAIYAKIQARVAELELCNKFKVEPIG